MLTVCFLVVVFFLKKNKKSRARDVDLSRRIFGRGQVSLKLKVTIYNKIRAQIMIQKNMGV